MVYIIIVVAYLVGLFSGYFIRRHEDISATIPKDALNSRYSYKRRKIARNEYGYIVLHNGGYERASGEGDYDYLTFKTLEEVQNEINERELARGYKLTDFKRLQ